MNNSDRKNILSHSGNYLVATVATKALALISVPVYTHLLTVEEYGIYNVFLSMVEIATIILTLNTEVAVSRFYYDSKDEDEFKRFVGTSVRLTFFVFLSMSLLLVLSCDRFSSFIGLEKMLVLSVIPMSLYSVLNSVFQQIYQPQLKSRKIAVVSSVQAYLAFALSVCAMLILDDKKYYGLVLGTLSAMLILGFYLVRQIKAFCIPCFRKSDVRYILGYSLPYLPYSLSGIIIVQLGKMIIGSQNGFESAGLYCFAANIASLLLVLILVIHQAWNPYYFKYMNGKEYDRLDGDYDVIWRVTLLCAAGFSLFSYEIGWILGRPQYLDGLGLVPVLSVGYVFYQWSFVYMRNVIFSKKIIWNALIVITSGVLNIILNSVLFGVFHEVGVALAFCISYMVMWLCSFSVNKWILRIYVPSIKKFLLPFLVALPFILVTSIPIPYPNEIIAIFAKFCLAAVLVLVLFFKFRYIILSWVKNGFKKYF